MLGAGFGRISHQRWFSDHRLVVVSPYIDRGLLEAALDQVVVVRAKREFLSVFFSVCSGFDEGSIHDTDGEAFLYQLFELQMKGHHIGGKVAEPSEAFSL